MGFELLGFDCNCFSLHMCSKAVPLVQIFVVCAFVVSCGVCLIIICSLSLLLFGASGGLCFMFVAFPGYLQLYLMFILSSNPISVI